MPLSLPSVWGGGHAPSEQLHFLLASWHSVRRQIRQENHIVSTALLTCACKLTERLLPPLAVFGAQAQAVTLTVAQAFKVALDLWEIAQEGEFIE